MTADDTKLASLRRIHAVGHDRFNAPIEASVRYDHDLARIENAALLEAYLRAGYVRPGDEHRANSTIDTLLVQAGRR